MFDNKQRTRRTTLKKEVVRKIMKQVENHWVYKPKLPQHLIDEYGKHDISPLLATIMANRNMTYDEYEAIKTKFWDIVYDYISKIANINIVAEELLNLLTNRYAKFYIFGDYDSDGITSLATVKEVWPQIRKYFTPSYDQDVFNFYAPERKEGYGMNKNWCKEVIEAKEKDPESHFVVVAFDNGVTKVSEIAMLKSAGITCYVIDHHEPDKILPDCLIVDPKKDANRFGEELCGSGLSWLLTIAMYKKLIKSGDNQRIKEMQEAFGKHLMYAQINAAIGTVADMVPMTLFNIGLVYHGLKNLNKDRDDKLHIDYLIDCFGLNVVTSKDVGFSLAAAINACGQMEDIGIALDLFLANNEDDYEERAEAAYSLYKRSRDITKDNKKIIQECIDAGMFDNHYFCIYKAKGIPAGIAGKLANYISNATGKPAVVVIDIDGQDIIKGSGRCVNPTLSLLKLLQPLIKEGLLAKANGHSVACGVELYPDRIDILQERLDEIIKQKIEAGEAEIKIVNNISIDAVIDISNVTWETFNDINNLPYSMNFSNPIFEVRGKLVKYKRSSSNPNNICYTLEGKNGNYLDIWAWNINPDIVNKIPENKVLENYQISLVGNLSVNFMRQTAITVDVIDLRITRNV